MGFPNVCDLFPFLCDLSEKPFNCSSDDNVVKADPRSYSIFIEKKAPGGRKVKRLNRTPVDGKNVLEMSTKRQVESSIVGIPARAVRSIPDKGALESRRQMGSLSTLHTLMEKRNKKLKSDLYTNSFLARS